MSRLPAPETCAQCGAEIPPSARACPECGADERTGWRETSIYDGLDLPDTAFDDGDTEARGPKKAGRRGLAWYWWVVALVLLLLLVAAVAGLR